MEEMMGDTPHTIETDRHHKEQQQPSLGRIRMGKVPSFPAGGMSTLPAFWENNMNIPQNN